jgi:hypothetical protein
MQALSDQTGIPEMQCYRIIKKFEKVEQVTRKTYNKCSVIQILNWKNYQHFGRTKADKMSHFNNDKYKPLNPLKKFL